MRAEEVCGAFWKGIVIWCYVTERTEPADALYLFIRYLFVQILFCIGSLIFNCT